MSLSWFTTIPGLLITGGVLLLVIALIIFIVTSIKDKNKSDNNVSVDAPTVGSNAGSTPVANIDSGASVNNNVVANEVPMPNQVEVPVSDNNFSVPEVGSNGDLAQDASLSDIPPATGVEVPQTAPVSDNFAEMPVTEVPTVEMPNNNIYSGDLNQAAPVETPSMDNGFGSLSDVQVPSVDQVVPEMQAAPSVEVPVVETPSVEMPAIGAASIETPSVEIPSIEAVPAVETPAVMPSMEVPQVQVPSVEIPNIETPTVNAPEVATPEVATPEVPTPAVNVPSVDTQSFGMPTMGAASIETPSVEIPSIETAPVETPVSNINESSPSIYGGANPNIVPDFTTSNPDPNPQIYGGANPLENTQSVSISDITGNNSLSDVENSSAEIPAVNQTASVEMPQVQAAEPQPQYGAPAAEIPTVNISELTSSSEGN